MSEAHKQRYLRELASANAVITKADAFIIDPDDPEWLGVDESKLPSDFVSYYRGLVSAAYAIGAI